MSARSRYRNLTPKRQLFVAEYPKDMNAGKAAIRAGYSPNGAGATGHALLKIPAVSAAIEAAMRARIEATSIDSEFVLRKLKEILDRTMAEITPALDRRGKAIRDGDGNPVYKFDAANALRSLELLGKHVAVSAFSENIRVDTDAEVIAALMAGRRRAAGILIDAEPDNSVVDALLEGRRRAAALPKPKPREDDDD